MKNLLTHKHPQNTSFESENKSATHGSGSYAKIYIPEMREVPKVKRRKIWLFLLLTFICVGAIVVLTGVLPTQAAYRKAHEFSKTGESLAQSIKNQNLEEAKSKLPETKQKLAELKSAWENVLLLKWLPFLNLYHQDGQHVVSAASYGLDAIEITVTTIEPYADLLGLKSGSSFVAGSADERIQLAVKTLDKVTPKIAEIGENLEKLKSEIDEIDPDRYPQYLQGKPVRSKIIEGKQLLNDTMGLFLDARPLLEVLPQLLGEPDPKRYLVLFQNDKELRPTGGFLTAYAIFKIEHGKILVEKSEDIYKLDERISPKQQALPEILNFHKGVYYKNIRDINISPDFSVSMKAFIDLYPGKFDLDGIIAVDTHVLVEAIKILGEFYINDRKFSAENDPRCDCPRVIYELEDYATRPVAYVRETRKEILGTLLFDIMKKALGLSPSQYWGQLFQMGIREINEKHILAYMLDEKSQKGVESLNLAGRIAGEVEILGYKDEQNWDYLHINDANMAAAKSNLFVQHYTLVDYTVESDGSIVKTITIDYKNPASPSDCNLERGGLCLNAYVYRNWLRIYVPLGSTFVEGKGSVSPKDEKTPIEFTVKEDLGKTVYEGFVTLRALGTTQVTLKYKLPFKAQDKQLMSLIQKQPGTEGHEYTISVNGKQKEKFDLKKDHQVSIKL